MNLGCKKSRKTTVVGEDQTRARIEGDGARNGMGGWHREVGGTRMPVVTMGDVEASARS